MSKLKPTWVKTDIPKDVKVKLWRVMKDNPTYLHWQQGIARASDEFDEEIKLSYEYMSRDTYKRLQDEIRLMPKQEIGTLPNELQAWIYDIRQNLKLQETVEGQSREMTSDSRLTKHFDKLAETADILAHHAQRLILYKDYDDIEAGGDVLSRLRFWRKSNRTLVTEGTDPTEEIEYETQHPVDPYLATCLYTHYTHRFGEPPFEGWKQLSIGNASLEIVDNLKLLAYGGLKPCPNCPICRETMH